MEDAADRPILILHNGVIVTMDPSSRVFRDGAVVVADDRIEAVGPSHQILRDFYHLASADAVVDLRGRFLLPGFVNTHVHTSQQLARGIADDVDLMTWLHKRIWPYESHMTEEDSYLSTLLCGIELIRSGVTCFAEAGGQHVSGMVRAVEELGLRACLAKSSMDTGDGLPANWSTCSTDYCIQSQRELYTKHHNTAEGRIRIWFGLRQIMNASDQLLLKTRDAAEELKTGIHMHVAEIPYENELVMSTRKVDHGTVTYLEKIGLLRSNLLAAHSVWLSDAEIGFFAKADVKVSHCPASAMRMLGFAPIKEMHEAGICVSLGTDGAPSNNRMSIVDEMYLASLINKGREAYKSGTTNPTVVPAAKLRQKISGRLHHFGDRGSELATRGKLVIYWTSRRSSLRKCIRISLYSATHLDPDTGIGKLSGEASLGNWKKTKHGENDTTTFEVVMYLKEDFGTPGAIAVKHLGQHQEFFLQSLTLDLPQNQSVHFECNSWVFPMSKTNADRLFFSNTSYLPSQTPAALQSLREEELRNLKGNGRGQREKWERIYDYDRYNDLGEIDKGQSHVRPILGGSNTYPYPRRCRTGRPLSNKDRMSESRSKIINLDFYVPPDDRFSPVKLSEFISNSIRAVVHFVVPEVKSLFEGAMKNFDSFEQISKDLYSGHRKPVVESMVMDRLKALVPEELHKEIGRVMKENPFKFPIPQVIAADEIAWRSDEEFAREMLAGLNPAVIRCLELEVEIN